MTNGQGQKPESWDIQLRPLCLNNLLQQ